MSDSPDKLSQLWQELKRRRVVLIIMVYASAAIAIIELINNLAEPLNLPPGKDYPINIGCLFNPETKHHTL